MGAPASAPVVDREDTGVEHPVAATLGAAAPPRSAASRGDLGKARCWSARKTPAVAVCRWPARRGSRRRASGARRRGRSRTARAGRSGRTCGPSSGAMGRWYCQSSEASGGERHDRELRVDPERARHDATRRRRSRPSDAVELRGYRPSRRCPGRASARAVPSGWKAIRLQVASRGRCSGARRAAAAGTPRGRRPPAAAPPCARSPTRNFETSSRTRS